MYEIINNHKIIIPKNQDAQMNTDGVIYADKNMIKRIKDDGTINQVINVAKLPGIVGNSLAMPDCHQGYGFCIGGVAAFDLDEGVISCGGVGFDINCGVRLLSTDIEYNEIEKSIKNVLAQLFRDIPTGTGKDQQKSLNSKELKKVLEKWCKICI